MTKIKTGHFKSAGVFSFMIKRNNEIIAMDQSTLMSDDGRMQLFLDGIIYNKNNEQLISGFLREGADFVEQLEGSFVLFLIKDLTLYISTDKVNSRKAFYTCVDGEWYISNKIDNLPKDKSQLSLDGLACYLANGVMLNDLTIFKDIRPTKRASIHSFKGGGLADRCYWDYKYLYPPNGPGLEEQLQKELEKLLIDCVKRRYDAASHPAALSLSAGNDSRGILGILHKQLKATDISCFSYASDDNPGANTDAVLARKLAETCGYDHRIIKSYNGDLIAFLKNNAKEGQCLSNLCDELDAWHFLAENKDHFDIFAGEECFGSDDIPLSTNAEIFTNVEIKDTSGVDWLKGFLSEKVYQDICTCLEKLTDDMIKKVSEISDPYDKQGFLYLDQRLNHFLMPWRENLTGLAGFVHNPYLDGEILDFMMKVPPKLRRGKSLYLKTITRMHPDLYSIPKAKSAGYKANWRKELVKNRKLLIDLILETDSRLDELISKEEIIAILNAQCSRVIQLGSFLRRGIKYLRRKNEIADHVFNIFLGPGVCIKGGFVYPDILLIRLLLMRIYLSPALSIAPPNNII